MRESKQLRHRYIGTEHILLGLIREGQGVAAQILARRCGDLAAVRVRVLEILEIQGDLAERPAEDAEDVIERLVEENQRLQEENERLRESLRRLGEDPGPATES